MKVSLLTAASVFQSLTEGVFAPALKLADYDVSTTEYCDDYLEYSPGYTDEARKSLVCVQPRNNGGMTCAVSWHRSPRTLVTGKTQ